MKAASLVSLVLVIVGGLNWGLIGMFNWDLVATLFGAGSALSHTVYTLVGVSALWQLVRLLAAIGSSEVPALREGGTQ